jgi:prevent-host-death family protein
VVIRIPIKRAKSDLYAVVRLVERAGERIVLTRHGRPVAALVPAGAIEALDLLGRLLPDVADVASGLPPLDPEAPGLGPAPGAPEGAP